MKKIHIFPTIVLSLFVLGIFFTQVNTFTSNTQHATTLKSDIAVPLSGDQLNARVASLPPPTEKVFLMGGNNGITYFNDIWTSSDAISWNLIQQHAGWSNRTNFAAFYFQDKIWVMGGVHAAGYFNDVWNSVDGINWNLVTSNAPWSARQIYAYTVFNNKIWLIGGHYSPFFPYVGNEIWSFDGIVWTHVDTNSAQAGIQDAPWQNTKIMTSAVSHNGMMFVMTSAGNSYSNDIWATPDGIVWTHVDTNPTIVGIQDAPWGPRAFSSTTSFNNEIYLTGGNSTSSGTLNDTWVSTNGVNWSQIVAGSPWSSRGWHKTFSLNNTLYLLGGGDISWQNYYKDIWLFNTTLSTWVNTLSLVPWNSGRMGHQVVVTPISFGLPDIIVTDLKWQEPIAGVPIGPGHNNPISQSTSNKYILFTATIKNDSAVPLAIPANHKMKLFSGTAPSVLAVNNINFGTSVTIPPQGTHTFNFSSQATPNMRATAGTYTLTLRADTSNVVVEKNENNNRIVKTLVIQ